MVEFALIAPVALLLLLTAIDLGRLLYSQIVVTNAAKEGALVASQGGTFQANQACSDTNTVMCGVLTEAKSGFVEVDKAKVSLAPALCVKDAQYPATGSPPTVSVTVTAPFRLLTPIISNYIAPNLVLSGVAQAQCLVVPRVTLPSVPAPVAAFTVSPSNQGTTPFNVSFDASASTSPGATITSYAWSFGGSGAMISKTFTTGTTDTNYTVTLTVTNSVGQTDTSTATITVHPVGTPTCAPSTASFTAVDSHNGGHPHQMTLSATATPGIAGISWAWTSGALTASGASPKMDFPSSGPQSVTLTGTKGSCTYPVTQVVTAP